MNNARGFVMAVAALSVIGDVASAQDLSRYRGYVLESTLESLIAASGARATDAKTIHERPAKIQELEWRAPYVSSGSELADPVREIAFTFFNDALYQVIVSCDRTDGLTNNPASCSSPRYHRARAVGDRSRVTVTCPRHVRAGVSAHSDLKAVERARPQRGS